MAVARRDKLSHARGMNVSHTQLNRVPITKLDPRPDVPVRLNMVERLVKSPVEFTVGPGLATKEKQAYYEHGVEADELAMEWPEDEGKMGEDVLTPGRVVETRR